MTESTSGYTDSQTLLKLNNRHSEVLESGDDLLTLLKKLRFSLVALVIVSAVPSAYAFRAASVASDSADVKQNPDPSSPTVATLPKGTRMNASDAPYQGYYRVRAANAGGWMQQSDMLFAPTAQAPAGQAPVPTAPRLAPGATPNTAAGANPALQAQNQNRRKVSRPNPRTQDKWAVKGFLGLDLFTPADINSATGSTALNNGGGGGAELSYRIGPRSFWVFRVEHITKSSSGNTSGTNGATVYPAQLTLGSTPVMTGFDYELTRLSRNWSLDISGLLGLAESTSLNGNVNSSSTPTIYTASPVTLLVKFDLNWELSNSFWFFGELGYRYLKTSQFSAPTTAGDSTSNSFFQDSNNNYIPFGINLSGPVINFGLRLSF